MSRPGDLVDGLEQHPEPPERAVILIGAASDDTCSVCRLVRDRAAVFLAPSVEAARSWLDDVSRGLDPAPHIEQGDLEIDLSAHEARWHGDHLLLAEREIQILSRLARVPGRAWTFAELYEGAWGSPFLRDPAPVHAAMKRLRHKLADAGVGFLIESVRGVGFRLARTRDRAPRGPARRERQTGNGQATRRARRRPSPRPPIGGRGSRG